MKNRIRIIEKNLHLCKMKIEKRCENEKTKIDFKKWRKIRKYGRSMHAPSVFSKMWIEEGEKSKIENEKSGKLSASMSLHGDPHQGSYQLAQVIQTHIDEKHVEQLICISIG